MSAELVPFAQVDDLDAIAEQQHDVRQLSSGMLFASKHGACTAEWGAPHHVAIVLDRFAESRGELRAEVLVRFTATGLARELIAPRSVPLLGTRAIAELAKDLGARKSDIAWRELLEEAFAAAVRAHRDGEPAVLLSEVPRRTTPLYELYPLALRGLLTVTWGRPDEGKTLIASAVACTLATGRSDILGASPERTVRVLWLDWEQDATTVADEIRLIAGDPAPDIAYLACRGAIWDERDRIVRTIREHGIEYLVIDSVGMACGGIPPESSEAALRFGTTLRQIGLGAFATAHLPKDQKADESAPFGSVFWLAQLRLGWLVKREHERDGSGFTVGLFAKKSNNDRLPAPLGFDVTFGPERIGFSRRSDDLAGSSELSARIAIRARLRHALVRGARVIHEIAEEIGEKPDTVRRTLQRYERKEFIRVPGADGVDRWALFARDNE